MIFKHFSQRLIGRTLLLLVGLSILAYFSVLSGYHATTLILLLIVCYQIYELLSVIKKTNSELTRFVEALRSADFSQRFAFGQEGSGFNELGQAFTEIVQKYAKARTAQEQELRHLRALIEHVPVPLLSVSETLQLRLWNNSARRLFGQAEIGANQDLTQYGNDFAELVHSIKPGERRVINFALENMVRQFAVQATQVIQNGRQETLISLQDIQSEIDQTQITAWQDLVKVLTHEIMNSITPVTSLANTAVGLAALAKQDLAGLSLPDSAQKQLIGETLDDVSDAVNTVARRSDNLMQFVTSYRRLTRLPAADRQTVSIASFLREIFDLVKPEWEKQGIEAHYAVTPMALTAQLDRGMVEQLLLNLLKNAEQALLTDTRDNARKQIRINAHLNKRGHLEIVIQDSGPGIEPAMREQVFVPFYTTKREGSGVGLALTRQVMTAHGGSVRLSDDDSGGAKFTLTF